MDNIYSLEEVVKDLFHSTESSDIENYNFDTVFGGESEVEIAVEAMRAYKDAEALSVLTNLAFNQMDSQAISEEADSKIQEFGKKVLETIIAFFKKVAELINAYIKRIVTSFQVVQNKFIQTKLKKYKNDVPKIFESKVVIDTIPVVNPVGKSLDALKKTSRHTWSSLHLWKEVVSSYTREIEVTRTTPTGPFNLPKMEKIRMDFYNTKQWKGLSPIQNPIGFINVLFYGNEDKPISQAISVGDYMSNVYVDPKGLMTGFDFADLLADLKKYDRWNREAIKIIQQVSIFHPDGRILRASIPIAQEIINSYMTLTNATITEVTSIQKKAMEGVKLALEEINVA